MPVDRRSFLSAAALAAGAAVVGAPFGSAAPQGRTEVVLENDDGVLVSEVTWYAPMPARAMPHPPEVDYLSFLRFRLAAGPDDPGAADAVISAQAGAGEGASSIDPVARNTVRELGRRGVRAEFWCMDRRFNALIDTTGTQAAVAARDYTVAWNYYFHGAEIDGRRFAGFTLRDERSAVLADIGLRQIMEDWHFINANEIPDPAVRRRKLFAGGHSYGGQIIALYASWDFGDRGDLADAGCSQLAGYVSIDGPMPIRVPLQDIPQLTQALRIGWDSAVGTMSVDAVTEGLRRGILPRTAMVPDMLTPLLDLLPKDAVPNPIPELATLINIIGIGARFQPDEESVLPRELPRTWFYEAVGRVLFGGDIANVLTGQRNFRDFRFTNEAVLGCFYDASLLGSAIATSFGTLDGGPVAERKFPFGTEFNTVPVLGWATSVVSWQPRMMPTEPGRLYRWRNYDRVGEPYEFPQVAADGGPLARPEQQHCDARQVARAWGTGRLGFVDSYMSMRQWTDEMFMLTGNRSGDFRFIRFEDFRTRLTGIQLVSEQLWGGKMGWLPKFLEDDRILVRDYSHQDMINAAPRQNDGSPDPVMSSIADYIVRTIDP
ncbi:twin-arginine translocation signal domain-containing protein [Nocardia sp. NPDC052566]|uniref:twin-arginine translocation signal domain-containing protein n=1 Tax=Nocardia sp. NPDC052566 TaxID=3364330 RepID=UPI0037C80BDB